MTELTSGGTVSLNAGKGIVADYKATGDLQTSLAALAKDPKTAWVAQLATRDAVTWNAVREAHQKWDHDAQGLSAAASIIIAIVVAVATGGAGAGLAGVAGDTVLGAAADAGFSALVSQASISLINNQGDLGKTMQEMGSLDTVKNLAIAMASAGAFEAVGTATDFHGVTLDKALDNPTNYAANVAGHAAVGCAMGAASGGKCGSGAAAAAVSAAATPVYSSTGLAAGTALSAGIGGATAKLTGGNAAQGALTGAFGYLYNQMATELQAKAWSQGSAIAATGLSASQQSDQYSSDLNKRVSMYAGVNTELTIGSGLATQGGAFATPGQANIGFYGTISPFQTGGNAGSSIVVGAQIADSQGNISGPGWSAGFSSVAGGASVNTDIYGNTTGLSWSPPSIKWGASAGPTLTCQVAVKGVGCN